MDDFATRKAAALEIVRDRYPCKTSEVGWHLFPTEENRWARRCAQRARRALEALRMENLVKWERPYWLPIDEEDES